MSAPNSDSIPKLEDHLSRRLRRNRDQSAHPSLYRVSGAERIRPIGSISFGALRAIAAGLARVQPPVPSAEPRDTPQSSPVLATAFYDVWLISWPDGSGLEPHDHGNVRSVLRVVDGELTEIFSDRVKRSDPAVRILPQGSSTSAEPSVVHALTNRSGADATTVHVYSPPLIDVTVCDLGANRVGSEEMAHSGRSRLTLVPR